MTLLPLVLISLSARYGGGEPLVMTSISEQACRLIVSQQTSDGAILMAKPGDAESSVVTYFACFAAQGLVAVYTKDHDRNKLEAARKWVDWYAERQNADGTIFDFRGRPGAWISTGHFDSTDSYAAVYLDLLSDLHRAAPDGKWLQARRRSIERAVAGIFLTMQPNGMTLSTPTYPVMYAMDNVETLRGLRAADALASTLGDKALAKRCRDAADKMQSAIATLLWDEVRGSYRVGIQTDGGRMEGLKSWYPDIMANLMAVGWLPPSQRNRELFGRLRRKFPEDIPSRVGSLIDLEHLIWWGWAAKGASDTELLETIRRRFQGFESVCSNGCDPGLLGHVARLAVP